MSGVVDVRFGLPFLLVGRLGAGRPAEQGSRDAATLGYPRYRRTQRGRSATIDWASRAESTARIAYPDER